MLLGTSFILCQEYKIRNIFGYPFLPWVFSSRAGNVTFTKLHVIWM